MRFTVFAIFPRKQEKKTTTKKNRITGRQAENKHGHPIFLLQFLNAQYMTDICAKFEKIWIVHHFQGNYFKRK